jgi:hypothetical protein
VEKQVKAGVDVIITHPRKVETGIDLLDFPTIVWMAIDYSVYTVLQASRRSWRIGQTEPVKVYYFAYEETIQEDALHLVAAKVAAALRVNGDTVGDDSLADLDDLTSGDLVATLAKIITGDVQIEARSLQQAFAEANASLRQANTIIGEYQMVEDEEKETARPELRSQSRAEGAVNGNGQTNEALPRLTTANRHPIRQPTLFSNGTANGKTKQFHLNGQSHNQGEPAGLNDTVDPESSTPPIPRPRLFGLPT